MSLPRKVADRIEQLLNTDSLTDAERAELNQILLSSVEARQFAYRCMEMTSMLRDEILNRHTLDSTPMPVGVEAVGEELPDDDATRRMNSVVPSATDEDGFPTAYQSRWWRSILAVAASLAIIGLGSWWSVRNGKTTPVLTIDNALIAQQESKQSGFAVIAKQADAVWATKTSFREGDLVGSRLMHLKSGTVRLELLSGVTIQLEGDVRFEIQSPMEMYVHRGKARATVPPAAHGFRMRTDAGQIVDLGTEFGVNVSDTQCDVHVLDGEIIWSGTNASQRNLLGGQAVRRTRTGEEQLISVDRELFLDDADLEMRSTASRKKRLAKWQDALSTVRRDPRLVCLYETAPSGPQSRRLPNTKSPSHSTTTAPASIPPASNSSASPRIGEGAIVAASRTPDRWQRSDAALDFGTTGSSIRLLIPGEYKALTLNAWVKINGLDRRYNSLFLTDGHDLNEPHWQITGDGKMFFSVKRRDYGQQINGLIDKQICFSPAFWNSSLSGQWIMLTTTYDSESRLVTHYLNGNRMSQEKLSDEYVVDTIRIGRASICNWNQPERDDPEFAVRNLNGSLDEFSMYQAALTDAEVGNLFEIGKP